MPNNEQYESQQPATNGLLNPDGSVTTFSGEILSPANVEGAKKYKTREPIANKFLNPDGSILGLTRIPLSRARAIILQVLDMARTQAAWVLARWATAQVGRAPTLLLRATIQPADTLGPA